MSSKYRWNKNYWASNSSLRWRICVGRVPYNISLAYGGFTANQWSNWITIHSPIVLEWRLPDLHLRCWLLYVKACSILRKSFLTKQEVLDADHLILHFCCFQELYGPKACTPNMHLHTHLMESVFRFWTTSGFFGTMPLNALMRSIESQLMQRFCQEQDLSTLTLPT